ncbi:hypothetical protein LMH87_002475 [Akanthomyces muscarius]|uniref:Uncharacterized protein n=1 Tax=Akanthomyces muscarius TaxID=2231603 RepID=A0A9W8UJG6_AKAMU|nr:hypothetical protein LMH87_002475 [Akanthomyces muscarius]KAJ4147984.1 hypothetical protein LMH87_002475 [Akanthomyces muscarius]
MFVPVPRHLQEARLADDIVDPFILARSLTARLKYAYRIPQRVSPYFPTVTMAVASALLIIVITILFPPAGAWAVSGCGMDLFINICLTILGYIPGHLHAFYLEYIYFDRREQAHEGRYPARPAPGVYSDNVQTGGQGYGTIVHQTQALQRHEARLPKNFIFFQQKERGKWLPLLSSNIKLAMAFSLLDMEMSSFRGWIFGMAIVDCLTNICVRAGRYYGRVKTNDRQPDETMKQLFTAFLILSSAAASLGALASFACSLELGSFIFISLNTLGSIDLNQPPILTRRVQRSSV